MTRTNKTRHFTMKCLLFSLVTLGVHVRAQQAAAATYGFGCGPEHAPFSSTLEYSGLPQLGMSVTVVFRAPTFPFGRTGTNGCLYTGFSNAAWAGRPLPIWLGPGFSSALHCMIWAPLEIATGVASGIDTGRLTLSIPPNPNLIGFRLYQQWRLLQLHIEGNEILGFDFWTNGGILTIGT